MAQTITTAYKEEITAANLNLKVDALLGGNMILKGYNVVAGSSGTKVSIVKLTDSINTLVVGGAIINETADLLDALTIPANSSGSARTDYIYAQFILGLNAVCTYGITSTAGNINSNCCLLATLTVPNGFTQTSQCTIVLATKMKSISSLTLNASAGDSDKLDGYHASNATASIPISNGTLNTNLNADLHDGYHAANTTGAIPISNGTVNTNLNADLLDGNHASAFATAAQGTKADAALPSASYTAADVLTKLKTVDGTGTGLDADLLDGNHASAFATATQGTKADAALPSASYTAADVLTKLKTVDGTGTGLDADLLDGLEASDFATAAQGAKADTYTAADVLTKLLTVDGTGTGLDADTVDGNHASAFALTGHTHAYLSAESDTLATVTGRGATTSTASTFNGGLTTNVLTANVAQGTAPLVITSTTKVANLNADLLDGLDSSAFATAAQGTLATNALPASSYTAADVLTKLKTVDGTGTGLDADLLDGNHSSAFATAAQGAKADTYTAADVLTKLLTVDGSTSGIDADLLDGNHASAFALTGHTHAYLSAESDTLATVTGRGATTSTASIFSGGLTTSVLTANVAQGTAPLVITSTTKVANLNADLLDGLESSAFATAAQGTLAANALPAASYTAADVLAKLKTVDGTGTALDADLLDGLHSSSFVLKNGDTMTSTLTSPGLVMTGDIINDGSERKFRATGTGINWGVYVNGTGTGIYDWQNTRSVLGYIASTNTITIPSKIITTNGILDDGLGNATHNTLILDVAQGSAPLTITSTTVNTNLNADLLDGLHSSSFATAAQGTLATNALPAASYTAADVLTKLKTVDGTTSGLDADLLDGNHSTAFATAAQGTKADNALPASSYTAADVLAKIKTVDGSTSGLDADTVDGKHMAAGSGTFNSTTGVTIAHSVGSTAFQISITLTSDPGGYLGEYWAIKTSTNFTIYCSGSTTTTTFDYVIIY